MTCLGEVASLERKSLLPEEIETGTSYLGLEHIESGGRILGYQRVGAGELQSNKFMFDPGTLLYGKLRPYLAKICIPDREGCCSTDILPIRPSQKLDISYLKHVLLWKPYVDKANSLCSGANLPRISPSSLLGIEIPLPPLEEQRRIAAILDKVRSILNLAEAREEAFRSFEESLFNHLFGSTHEQRCCWAWEQFGSLCSRLTVGVVVKPASYYRETGVPALRSLNVKPGQVVETNLVYISEEHNDGVLSKSRLSCGDLVFVRSGRPGTCAVIPPSLDGCNAIDLLLATTDSTRILPGFASSYFNSAGGRASIFAESRGQVQQHFNAGSLASALVPVPPIEIQEEFCNTLKARNGQLTKCEFSIENLKALSKALEKSLMSGNHP
ncbi:MAG: restriction endonuclease subunit S [Cyanobacteriota bacterium]